MNLEQQRAEKIQKEMMEKYGFTNWKYISIATKNEDTRKALLNLGFVEPLKESVRNEGGCLNLYYSTESQEEFIKMQEKIKDLDYIGIELNPMATADYVLYLEGITDPRD